MWYPISQLLTTTTNEHSFAKFRFTVHIKLHRDSLKIFSFVNHFNLYSKRPCYIVFKNGKG